MQEESDGGGADAPEADLGMARRTAVVSHGVVIKFQEMGLPEGLYDDLARLSSDLGDLWSAQKALTDRLDSLVRSPHDWEDAGDHLVDLRANVDHIAWHVKSVRRPSRRSRSSPTGRRQRRSRRPTACSGGLLAGAPYACRWSWW